MRHTLHEFITREAAACGRMKPKRLSAKTVLAQMMKDLHEHDWPSDETWAVACRVLGRPVPKPLDPGERISIIQASVEPSRQFKP